MRSDLLSKRLFLVGCLGLPWLWTVHVMNHGNTEENDEGLLNPDDHFHDSDNADEAEGMTAEDIKIEATKWIWRARIGALLGWLVFIGWIVVAQVLRSDVLPSSLYMLNQDSAELTGW